MPHNNTLTTALEYFERGWSLVPMRMAEKRPAIRWKKLQTERAGKECLRAWFGAISEFGLGVIFGQISGGLASRDFDELEVYQRWAADHPKLAKTLPTVETRRGCHVYFRTAPDAIKAIRKRLGKPYGTGAIVVTGGELRAGVGCYSVLPPSKHPSGFQYRWRVPLPKGELPQIDPWEENLIDKKVATETLRHRDKQAIKIVEKNGSTMKENSLASVQEKFKSFPVSIQLAIANTLPNEAGERNRKIFEFCRELKAVPELAKADVDLLEQVVRVWHALALPAIRTIEFETTLADFWHGWERVRFAAGVNPLPELFRRACEAEPPLAADRYEATRFKQLVAFCRELQREAGEQPFFLAARAAGGLLGIDAATASRWLSLLVRHQVLGLAERGSQATGRASRYRYLVRDGPG